MNVNCDDMTLREFAEYFHLHYNTIWKYAHNGTIPAYRLGWKWYIPRSAIDDLRKKAVKE